MTSGAETSGFARDCAMDTDDAVTSAPRKKPKAICQTFTTRVYHLNGRPSPQRAQARDLEPGHRPSGDPPDARDEDRSHPLSRRDAWGQGEGAYHDRPPLRLQTETQTKLLRQSVAHISQNLFYKRRRCMERFFHFLVELPHRLLEVFPDARLAPQIVPSVLRNQERAGLRLRDTRLL